MASQSNNINQFRSNYLPIIPLSLYWACIGTGSFLNLDVLALMEQKLARHFRYYGIISQQIGDLVEYRGKRGFFLIQPNKFRNYIKAEIKELFDFIDLEIKTQWEKFSKYSNNKLMLP